VSAFPENTLVDFPRCQVCGAGEWESIFTGAIRDGVFGSTRVAEVRRCSFCGVDRLAESACLGMRDYESLEYRDRLAQSHQIDKHRKEHDELARFTLEALWPLSLRGRTVADVGCGGGVLLDHIAGVAQTLVAIEPNMVFAEDLRARGYRWYSTATDAVTEIGGMADVVFSTQVIEHVDDPFVFLKDIHRLLKPGGIAIVSTPNREDILMELLPDTFPSFFYRTQHRWSFNAQSLSMCATRAGLRCREVRNIHRYGLSNTLYWLKEASPSGRKIFPPIDDKMDKLWQCWLESVGKADNLFLIAERPMEELA
jgi:2-polyprenyl-3-methyl-5-hydroxy-6-metoxy-1,4-benzoquinol methylase